MLPQFTLKSIPHPDPQTYHWFAGCIRDINYDLYAFFDEDFDCWRILSLSQHLDSVEPVMLFQAFIPDTKHLLRVAVESAYPALKREMLRHLEFCHENN